MTLFLQGLWGLSLGMAAGVIRTSTRDAALFMIAAALFMLVAK